MAVIIVICLLLSLAYATLMMLYRKGWKEQPAFVEGRGFVPGVSISVIIPARNEEHNIGACISSILAQDYPQGQLEIIVVDDHSTDRTAAVVASFAAPNIRCIDLAQQMDKSNEVIAFKKLALTNGIEAATGDLIVTTDADCVSGRYWLRSIAAIYRRDDPVMIVAPVDFVTDRSVVQVFQSLDFMSMQGITAAAHQLNLGNMSNGANLAFTKKAFNAVGGYSGVDHMASGDDYLLMMKLKDVYPSKISYLKSRHAIVKTTPQPTWGDFLQQRIRWASKSGKYNDNRLTVVLLLVYLYNFSFLMLLIAGFADHNYWAMLLVMLVLKTEVELYYLYPVAGFFGKKRQLIVFPLLQPLHILYIIIAGFLGFAGVYSWKGRKVK